MTPKLDIHTFGEQLIKTRDLDPLYVGLVGAALPRDQLYRWLFAYWCFYHVGVASYMSDWSDPKIYWFWMQKAARNAERHWHRGAERRHFRGPRCIDAIDKLSKSRPTDLIASLPSGDAANIMKAVQEWPMFGKWISFKVVDMLERVAGWPVSIPSDMVLMYDEPRKALDILTTNADTGHNHPTPEKEFEKLTKYFVQYKAPPRDDRPCGPAEVETVLCKWKSYLGGHYYVGKDIHEQRHGLQGWGATAERLLEHYPSEVESDRKHTRNERQRQVNNRPTLYD
jgi:hypothetical protein